MTRELLDAILSPCKPNSWKNWKEMEKIDRCFRTTKESCWRGRKRVLSEEDLIRIEEMIKENPGITLREIVETLELSAGGETVRRAIKRMGYYYHRKKKVRRISKRDHARYMKQTQRG